MHEPFRPASRSGLSLRTILAVAALVVVYWLGAWLYGATDSVGLRQILILAGLAAPVVLYLGRVMATLNYRHDGEWS